MEQAHIDRVRRFNRAVTQRIGALDEEFLARSRSLGQSRLLWEIGPGGCRVRDLRSRLNLDSGYVSRLLRALQADGLVEVAADEDDARIRAVRLTPAGLAERAALDRGSDRLAASILTPLTQRQRERLVTAMAEVERLMAASQIEIAVTDPARPAARRCMNAYFAELASRFDDGFDPALSISADDVELRLPAGLLLVATLHTEPVGCGALKLHPDEAATGNVPDRVAEIKRMWVSPDVRGLGLGRRLLAELESLATVHGASLLRLETNASLSEAIAMYRSAGYVEVPAFNAEPYAHHWFEKRLRS